MPQQIRKLVSVIAYIILIVSFRDFHSLCRSMKSIQYVLSSAKYQTIRKYGFGQAFTKFALKDSVVIKNRWTTACFSTSSTDFSQNLVNAKMTLDNTTSSSRKWNLQGLKQEVNRAYLRTFRKITKANEKKSKQKIEYDFIMKLPSDEALDELEKFPDLSIVENEIIELQNKLTLLSSLEEQLKMIKSTTDKRFLPLSEIAINLNISDTPTPVERGPKKEKGKPKKPRKPYFIYQSIDGIEIRVGRRAEDNDELSCNPEHRDGSNWWLHVAGCPGSHVVIRTDDDDVTTKFSNTLIDAALLAVVNSKANPSGKVAVSFTRCRNVTKPRGAKPGLVHLGGEVGTIKVDVKVEAKRLERVQQTKEIDD